MRALSKIGLIVIAGISQVMAAGIFEWGKLSAMPDAHGFAGVYAGVVSDGSNGDTLLVAGGANFPGKAPWDGGAKEYHRSVFALPLGTGGEWRELDQPWPEPVGYGMSVSLRGGSSLFLGGQRLEGEGEQALASVRVVGLRDGKLSIEDGPTLPEGRSEGVAEVVGDLVIVVAGVTDSAEGKNFKVLQTVVALDTSKPRDEWKWETLPWPESSPGVAARGRMHPTAGVRDGIFYLFGGRDFPDPAVRDDQTDERIFGADYLRDAYAFDVAKRQWRRLADLPHGLSAAPSTAVPTGATHLAVLGGVPVSFLKEQLAARPDTNGQGPEHPGFPAEIHVYDTMTNTWAQTGMMPKKVEADHAANPAGSTWAPVTTRAVLWNGAVIIPTGEVKPGIRSPQVLIGKIVSKSAHFGWINWAVVGIYLLGMVGVGYWFMKREASATTEAYFRGGQRVPWWVAGLSIFATMLSALTFMGIPARAYQTDVTWYIGQLSILLVVPLVVWFYLPFFRKLDLTSAYEYLEKRFNLVTRIFASLSFILFHIGRIAIVLYLPALALAAVSDIGVMPSILMIGVLCVSYTVMGGIEAVVWTDAIQALVLMAGALLCLILVVMRLDGGIGQVYEIANTDNKLFENLRWDNFDFMDGTATTVVLFVAFFFNSLVPYTSGQDVVQRYVTTKDIGAARRSLWMTMWMSVFGAMIFFALGAALYAFYKTHPGQLDPAMAKTDSILPFFIMQQLPIGVSGLIIAAIFAAAQSTISSSLNSVATAWIKDFDSRLLRPDRDDATYLRAAKWVVLIIGVAGISVACVMAVSNIESAFKAFNSLIGLTAGALGGLFALGVFTRRANGKGAMIGALFGFASVLFLYFSGSKVSGLLYAFIGFAVCFVIGYLVSLITGVDRGRELSIHG